MEVISLIMAFIFGEAMMLLILYIIAMSKEKKPRNKVHFYVARDKKGSLWLYLGKPERQDSTFSVSYGNCGSFVISEYNFKYFGINKDDFNYLKWEDEPVEVFINMED